MSFCEHCQGQRFDRSRVLRALREVRKRYRAAGRGPDCDAALTAALEAVRALDIPHLEPMDFEGEIVH
jgi:hypothetical protein